MVNVSKVDQLLKLWSTTHNCIYCPCRDECPYFYTGDIDECLKILKKWISTI